MSTPFFKWLNDRETLVKAPDGWHGTRYAQVNTGRAARALAFSQMPDVGDPWDDDLKDCTVQLLTTKRLGGTDNAQGIGGWTEVQLDYSTPGAGVTQRPTEPGTRYTDPGFNQQTIKIYTAPPDGLAEPAGAEASVFHNGQGAQIEVAELAVKVYAYYLPNDLPPLATMLALTNKVNANRIVLPPLVGRTQKLVLQPGQARVRAPTFKAVGRAEEVCWELVLALDHYERWRNEKADGTLVPAPGTDPYFARKYQRAAMPENFPG